MPLVINNKLICVEVFVFAGVNVYQIVSKIGGSIFAWVLWNILVKWETHVIFK